MATDRDARRCRLCDSTGPGGLAPIRCLLMPPLLNKDRCCIERCHRLARSVSCTVNLYDSITRGPSTALSAGAAESRAAPALRIYRRGSSRERVKLVAVLDGEAFERFQQVQQLHPERSGVVDRDAGLAPHDLAGHQAMAVEVVEGGTERLGYTGRPPLPNEPSRSR